MSDSIANIVERVETEAAHKAAHNIETLAVAIGHIPEPGDIEMIISSTLRAGWDQIIAKLERR